MKAIRLPGKAQRTLHQVGRIGALPEMDRRVDQPPGRRRRVDQPVCHVKEVAIDCVAPISRGLGGLNEMLHRAVGHHGVERAVPLLGNISVVEQSGVEAAPPA